MSHSKHDAFLFFWAELLKKEDTRKVVCNKKGGMAGEIGEGLAREIRREGLASDPMTDTSVIGDAATSSPHIHTTLRLTFPKLSCDDKQSSPFDPRTRTLAQVSTSICVANDAAMWLDIAASFEAC